jgi:hypothetical protein
MLSLGVVKKMAQPPVKLIHDKALDLKEEMVTSLEDAMKYKPELKNCINRVYDNLDPIRVLQLFESMVEQVPCSYHAYLLKALTSIHDLIAHTFVVQPGMGNFSSNFCGGARYICCNKYSLSKLIL